MQAQTPRRLIAVDAVEALGRLVGRVRERHMMPALLNAMSSRPNVATVRSTIAATWSSSATSHVKPSAW